MMKKYFIFEPKDRNITQKYMPVDTVPVDITVVSQGWQVYHHQSLKIDPPAPVQITNLVQFVKSQLEYISQ